MRVLIAADKFKGSLTGQQVAEAIEQGLRSANLRSANTISEPDETVESAITAAEVDVHRCAVSDGVGHLLPSQRAFEFISSNQNSHWSLTLRRT